MLPDHFGVLGLRDQQARKYISIHLGVIDPGHYEKKALVYTREGSKSTYATWGLLVLPLHKFDHILKSIVDVAWEMHDDGGMKSSRNEGLNPHLVMS